ASTSCSKDLQQKMEAQANQRALRKIMDLEIANESLLAVNMTLETTIREQALSMEQLKRQLAFARKKMIEMGLDIGGEVLKGTPAEDERMSEEEEGSDVLEFGGADQESEEQGQALRRASLSRRKSQAGILETDGCLANTDDSKCLVDQHRHHQNELDDQLHSITTLVSRMLSEASKALQPLPSSITSPTTSPTQSIPSPQNPPTIESPTTTLLQNPSTLSTLRSKTLLLLESRRSHPSTSPSTDPPSDDTPLHTQPPVSIPADLCFALCQLVEGVYGDLMGDGKGGVQYMGSLESSGMGEGTGEWKGKVSVGGGSSSSAGALSVKDVEKKQQVSGSVKKPLVGSKVGQAKVAGGGGVGSPRIVSRQRR
ncbi:hypothetical protein HDV05_007654, partial [Chytridiales sp. JEL 0842]